MNTLFIKFLNKKRKFYQEIIKREVNNYWKTQGTKNQSGITDITKVGIFLLKGLGQPSDYFLRTNSKKLRPILGYLIKMAFDPTKNNMFERYLILPEILHSSSLIVDDIEDNAKIRRGIPSVHIKYGIDSAINLANALYFFPYHFLANSRLSRELKIKINNTLTYSLNRMHLGQAIDIYWHKNPLLTISADQYLIMAKLKTSSFFKAEAELAVIFSKTNGTAAKKAIRFAEGIGAAFQITDDILDITLDNKEVLQFGKEFGQDITEGKKTLIVAYALKRATPKDRKKLQELLVLHTKRKEMLDETIAIFKKYECITDAKLFSEDLIRRSWTDFSKLLRPSQFKDYLNLYCRFIIERRF